MLHIELKYKDEYTNGNWSYQECYVNSLRECMEIYGLNECEYEIIKIEEVK